MKNKYEKPEMEWIKFSVEEITSSWIDGSQGVKEGGDGFGN